MKYRPLYHLTIAVIIIAFAVVSFAQQTIPSTQAQSSPISNLSVKDTANAANWSIQSNLQVGNFIYGDRLPPSYNPGYSFTVIPSALLGTAWIRTAQASKSYTGTPLVTFSISSTANVYVGVDDRVTKPSWLDATWIDAFASGMSMIEAGGSGLTRTFSVYQKTFAAGTVLLGPSNASSANDYTVIVVPTITGPTATHTNTPTITPTFVPTTVTPTNDPDARARAIVAQMTIDEKVLEMHGVGGSSPNIRIVPAISRLNIPAFVITNGPDGAANGTISPVPPSSAMPVTLSLAASWDVTSANTYGAVIGKEARVLGNDLIEGPNMNLARIPQGGRTFENLGEDPFLAGQIAVADIQGIQSQGEIAEAKHFVGNEQEDNRFGINDTIDQRTLRELYLYPFEQSVKQGKVGAVMCAYPSVNGAYSCENAPLQNQILKGEWGFTGLITSDFGAVHSTVASALNGLDLEMPSGTYFGSALKTAEQNGQVPMSVIDEHLVRRFRTTMQMGLWDSPPPDPSTASISAALKTADGAQAKRIAEEGMVLLQNSGNILPLNATSIKTIALIGPYAGAAKSGGGGSSKVNPLYTVTPQTGLQNRVGTGVTINYNDGSNLTTAQSVAQVADVAIVMVGDSRSEGHDYDIALSGNQDALVSAVASVNKHTIVVVKSGSVILMPWVSQVPAILEAWYPGEEDGNAVAGVLFGDFNPSGKLPITFPKSKADLPANTSAQYPTTKPASGLAQADYSEGLLMGYRWYDAKNITPLFPFGFGLSYTTYTYANLKITPGASNTATVEFDITNTGTRVGAEVAQVYVGMPAAAGEPPKQLKGFAKLHLNPAQTGHVTITLDARAFQHWNSATSTWAITAGTYQIMVGSSSRTILLTGTITQ